MNPTLMICKAFLEASPLQEELLRHLPLVDKEKMSHMPALAIDALMDGIDIPPIEKIHVSWIAPIIRNFSEKEMSIFFSFLSENQCSLLEKELRITRFPMTLTEFAKVFFLNFLYEKILDKDKVLPIQLLPPFPLNHLLSLSFTEMDDLLSLLAMYDLSAEMRLIIDTKKIKLIQDSLSSLQKNYLRSLFQQRNTLNFGKLDLAKWDMDPQNLHKVLFQRGMNRLAKACYGSDSSFLWYISHMLDVSSSNTFLKLSTPMPDNEAQEVLIAQISEILNYMKKKL